MHIPAVFSQQIFVGLHQKGAQCLSCKRAVCNDTFPIRVAGQFPCLRKSLIVKVLVETVLELVAAPQCRFTKWLQFDDGHVLSLPDVFFAKTVAPGSFALLCDL